MEKVLITSAVGFLGSHLCDRFIKEGFMVIGMDNFITRKKNIKHLIDNNQFEFIQHDVTKYIKTDEELYKRDSKDFTNHIKIDVV